MKSICIASLAAIIAVAQNKDCISGEFETYNDKCMFDCEYKDNYVEISTLSFDFIRNRCDNVNEAYQAGKCGSLDDLVYREDYCTCPYCKCSSTGYDLVEIFTIDSPSKECNNCTCVEASSSYGIRDKIYQCDTLISVDEPYEWDFYACPPNECIEEGTYGTTIRHAGDSWFGDVGDSDTLCTKFCYCPADGDAVCATGYDNILANDDLKTEFIDDQCDWRLRACVTDTGSLETNRLITFDSGPTCYSCPRCSCPTGYTNQGDTWYHEYQDSYYSTLGYESCATCQCTYDDYYEIWYSECNYVSHYPPGTQTCGDVDPTADTWTCHEQASASGTKASSINATICYNSGDDGPTGGDTQYCQWQYSNDPDDDSYQVYEWGCGNSILCEAYADDQCIYTDASKTLTDCWGASTTETFKQYIKCCDASSDPNCNFEDASADSSSCSRSYDLEDLFETIVTCQQENENKYGCDDNVEYISCSDLLDLYRGEASCQCDLYGGIYGRVSSASQTALQDEIDIYMSRFSEWNEALGCNINLECTLTSSGGVVKNNSSVGGKVYIIAVLWAVIIAYIAC